MPTYEYECKSCGHAFEAFQSMSDAPLSECPECGKAIRRVINGGTGIIFKGSGFYVTDKGSSRSSSAKKETKSSEAPCASCAKSETPSCPQSAAG